MTKFEGYPSGAIIVKTVPLPPLLAKEVELDDYRSLTLDARALLIEILWLMEGSVPWGHLNLETADLARLIQAPEPEVEALLPQVLHLGVFVRTGEHGFRLTDSLLRAHAIRLRRAAGGRLGGNPALKKCQAISSAKAPCSVVV